MKPKEFLFKKKGSFFRGDIPRDYKIRKKGTIYLSNTHLRINLKNGGELNIPLNTIKNLNLYNIRPVLFGSEISQILIQAETNELYTFGTYTHSELKKLYRLLSEAIASLPDGGDVHVGPRSISSSMSASNLCELILLIIAVIFSIGWLMLNAIGWIMGS